MGGQAALALIHAWPTSTISSLVMAYLQSRRGKTFVLLAFAAACSSVVSVISEQIYRQGPLFVTCRLPRASALCVAKLDNFRSTHTTAMSAGSSASDDVVVQFDHVKSGLGIMFKFWMMGGCGDAIGWMGVGQLTAAHAESGAQATLEIDADAGTLRIIAEAAPSPEAEQAFLAFAWEALKEVDGVASTEEAPIPDRLAYPPEAAAQVRVALTERR